MGDPLYPVCVLQKIIKVAIFDRTHSPEISPNPSFPKRGIPPFVKGGGFLRFFPFSNGEKPFI
jgi:hypothetical protein